MWLTVPSRPDQVFTSARDPGLLTVLCVRGEGRNGYLTAKNVKCVRDKVVFPLFLDSLVVECDI